MLETEGMETMKKFYFLYTKVLRQNCLKNEELRMIAEGIGGGHWWGEVNIGEVIGVENLYAWNPIKNDFMVTK